MLHALRTSFPGFSFIEVHRNRSFFLQRWSTLFVTRFMRKVRTIAACMTSHTAAHSLSANSLFLAPAANNKLLASCPALQMA